MARPRSTRPTDAEMEVLSRLWARGPSTIREVHNDVVAADRTTGHTSIATIMQILVKKGFARVADSHRPQRFVAVIDQDQACRAVTDEWLERMCGGSIVELVRHALADRTLTKKERAALRTLIDSAQ